MEFDLSDTLTYTSPFTGEQTIHARIIDDNTDIACDAALTWAEIEACAPLYGGYEVC